MCTKHLVCARNTWYVPERPDMFSKILSCVRKPCHMWTQLMIDHFLQIITRFLYLQVTFMDNVSGVPSMRRGSMCTKHLVCERNTWYVPERPDMFSEILSCVTKRCHMWTQLMIDHFLQIITWFLEQYTNSSFILTKCSPTANRTQSMGYLVFTMPPTKQASVRSFSLRRPTTGKVGMWRRKIRWKGAYAQKMHET